MISYNLNLAHSYKGGNKNDKEFVKISLRLYKEFEIEKAFFSGD